MKNPSGSSGKRSEIKSSPRSVTKTSRFHPNKAYHNFEPNPRTLKTFISLRCLFFLVIEMVEIENVRLISVVGAGTMGTLIGQVFATYGF